MADVVVIGAGASGLLVATHLLRAGFRGGLTLVGKQMPVGEGVAYSTQRPEHLLNVVAGRMSALDDDPGHFVRYLKADSKAATAGLNAVFAQRRQYARYLRDTFDQANASGVANVVKDEVISAHLDGTPTVFLRSGQSLKCDHVVLALGNTPRAALANIAHGVPESSRVSGWDYESVVGIKRESVVCIAGSGLSMVDAVLTLDAQRHRGAIHVLSRHGLMPLPHAPSGHVEFDQALFEQQSLVVRARHLRIVANELQSRGEPWQWLMDTLRPHNSQWWRSLSIHDQSRFLRHVARFWDVHRHRIPPSAWRTIQSYKSSGQLRVHRARLRSVHWDKQRCQVVAETGNFAADCIIDCTGLATNIRRMNSPLISGLLDAGVVRPGAHELGIDADVSGAVIGRNGQSNAQLSVVGSLRIGTLWESVAIPELRVQAEQVANRIVKNQRPSKP